ncbi:hypothetical protein IEQ34_013834 [Dendrobium chrysotoxum]|uniref:Uncharacterized protein n=1 Tax=Dendrobium chrysotoxum TaxID=161865 RepID=A0AAV7G9Q6_DENCH|nr:hypothetical protein IEQ34_013834 [Dendrobium chrysotoxum]
MTRDRKFETRRWRESDTGSELVAGSELKTSNRAARCARTAELGCGVCLMGDCGTQTRARLTSWLELIYSRPQTLARLASRLELIYSETSSPFELDSSSSSNLSQLSD